jgi:hypothetical protein
VSLVSVDSKEEKKIIFLRAHNEFVQGFAQTKMAGKEKDVCVANGYDALQ